MNKCEDCAYFYPSFGNDFLIKTKYDNINRKIIQREKVLILGGCNLYNCLVDTPHGCCNFTVDEDRKEEENLRSEVYNGF